MLPAPLTRHLAEMPSVYLLPTDCMPSFLCKAVYPDSWTYDGHLESIDRYAAGYHSFDSGKLTERDQAPSAYPQRSFAPFRLHPATSFHLSVFEPGRPETAFALHKDLTQKPKTPLPKWETEAHGVAYGVFERA